MDELKTQFTALKEELVRLGEDEKELSFWEIFFDVMTDEEKAELLSNLRNELEDLNKR